jgi:FkbM family methyltransferase
MLESIRRAVRRALKRETAVDKAMFAHQLLYGAELDVEELSRLRSLGVFSRGHSLAELMRRIRAATDAGQRGSAFLIRMGPESISWVEHENFRLAVDNADVAVSHYVMHSGAWEPHLNAMVRRTLKPGMSVIDVGANIGYYSLLAARLVGQTGRVTAFEPNSENNRLLLLSRAENGFEQIQLMPVALGDRPGHATFSVAMGSNGGLRNRLQEELHSPQCQIVPVVRLDDVFSGPVDFIKMDIEGAEPLALAGAERTLTESRPVVSSEFCPFMIRAVSGSDPLAFLQRFASRGYDAFLVDKQSHAEVPIGEPADFLSGYGSEHRIEDLLFRPRV